MTTTITPSVGAGIAMTQGGVGASPGYAAIDARRLASAAFVEGVLSAAGWKVSENSPQGMSVVIDADVDGAYIQGDAVTDQGLYYVPPHSGNITEAIAAAHATNPRIDRVVLEALDDTHDGSGSSLGRTRVITGTPGAGATLANQTGAAAIPNGALHLADVLVPATATTITSANIRDYRAYARRESGVGDMIASFTAAKPGWLVCDGRSLNRKQYARLFAAIGTGVGTPPDSETFLIPDARGRMLAGWDNMGTQGAAGVMTGPGTGGAQTHTLTVPELPAHSHELWRETGAGGQIKYGIDNTANGGEFIDSLTEAAGIQNTGGGGAHNNMPPYRLVWVHIFTGSAV